MANFLATGLDEAIIAQCEKADHEKAELQTINVALGKRFPQKAELELTRENHAAVIRELQKMQDNPGYISDWMPKTLENGEPVAASQTTQDSVLELPCKLSYGTPEKRTEYIVSRQHNGYEMEGPVLRRVYYDNQIGSIGQSLYTDGQWHTTANLPPGAQIMQFKDVEMALKAAKDDATKNGLMEMPSVVPSSQERNIPQAQIDDRQQAVRLQA